MLTAVQPQAHRWHDRIIASPPTRSSDIHYHVFSDGSRSSLKKSPMTTPHRGLPPPTSIGSHSESLRAGPPPPLAPSQARPSSHGYAPLPPQPQTYAARSEEGSVREGYYMAKAEEHKRYQEEEKTRQQQLRLEQRKVEHDMLREALRGGVPPHLVPSLFASLDGPRTAGADPIQHYQATTQPPQPEYTTALQSRGSPPELRRETRTIPQTHGVYYPPPGSAIPPMSAQPPPPMFNPSAVYPSPANQSPRGHRPSTSTSLSHHLGPASTLNHPATSSLPRLTTNEAQVHQPISGPTPYGPDRASPSPSISFHHWQPPTIASRATGETTKTSPRQPSTLSSGESVAINSPRKRKDMRPHHAPPPPAYAPIRDRSPVSERPPSSSGRPHHSRNSSTGTFRARPYDPVGRNTDRMPAPSRRRSPEEPLVGEREKMGPHEQEGSSMQGPESAKTEAST